MMYLLTRTNHTTGKVTLGPVAESTEKLFAYLDKDGVIRWDSHDESSLCRSGYGPESLPGYGTTSYTAQVVEVSTFTIREP